MRQLKDNVVPAGAARRSSRRATELPPDEIGLKNPILKGGSFVAVALYATAGLVSEHTRRLFPGRLSYVDADGGWGWGLHPKSFKSDPPVINDQRVDGPKLPSTRLLI